MITIIHGKIKEASIRSVFLTRAAKASIRTTIVKSIDPVIITKDHCDIFLELEQRIYNPTVKSEYLAICLKIQCKILTPEIELPNMAIPYDERIYDFKEDFREFYSQDSEYIKPVIEKLKGVIS